MPEDGASGIETLQNESFGNLLNEFDNRDRKIVRRLESLSKKSILAKCPVDFNESCIVMNTCSRDMLKF